MINKIIFINYQPITLKYISDFYLKECLDSGCDVEYWDITKLYFPSTNTMVENDFDFKILEITSFKQLNSCIRHNNVKDKTLFITNITYEYKVLRFFRILTRHKCLLGFFARGMYPMPDRNVSSKIISVLKSYSLKKISNIIKNKFAVFLKKVKIIKTLDIIFRAGSKGVITIGGGYQYDLIKAKIVDINYFDFDKYLVVSKEKFNVMDNYCVFLDVYLPYHPDINMIGIDTVDPKKYYFNLNKYFDFLEQEYAVSVVICAHPKALSYKNENPFNGRLIVFNQTCEYVKGAKFAITNYSTSISFPILFRKPIYFITCEEEKEKMYDLYETSMHLSKVLNSQISFFDKLHLEINNGFNVDDQLYNDYVYKYLTSKASENDLTSVIFTEAILKL